MLVIDQDFLLSRRFGFGPRISPAGRQSADFAKLLLSEIASGGDHPIADDKLLTVAQALSEHEQFQEEEKRRAAIKQQAETEKAIEAARKEAMQKGERVPPGYLPPARRIFNAEATFRFRAALDANTGLTERLVWFWSNHFAIAIGKGNYVQMTAGAFEREAIRPNMFGSFRALLKAAEQHPAMLMYLDNRLSIGPNSRAGARRGRGLNENHARELLELHTMGVNGGYSQDDVTTLAKALTGWTVGSRLDEEGELGAFHFNANRHEPGKKTVVGRTYADEGLAQGERILDDLASHPSTANFIAWKLVRHFVEDEPDVARVAKIAKVFRATGGDLSKVYIALVEAGIAAKEARKVRPPLELVVASLRATEHPLVLGQALQFAQLLGQPLWNPPGPNGFPDASTDWITPAGMKVRLEVATAIARRTPGGANPTQALDTLFGDACSAQTRQAVGRAESRAQGFAILLMSPEIQRR
ncbi:MAG: DUF1800 domain-containing protein [Beijerinckiaceae bacterium]|nr:DUF1800 domain-containing protein [Beijerinckiaceae bacterium]